MKKGKIISVGTPDEIINPEIIESVYQINCDIDQGPIYNKPRIHPI